MDRLNADRRSRLMAAVKGKDTVPELQVRRLVHGMGFRYRLHCRTLPGRPDLVFRRLRAAIFVHGCFWHAHTCRWGRIPKSNKSFWSEKRLINRKRDRASIAALRRSGWRVLVVWGCQVRDTERLSLKLSDFLGGRRSRIVLERSRPLAREELWL